MSAVSTEYRHLTKEIEPAPAITRGGTVLKWYDIAPADEPVPSDVLVLARGTLHVATEAGLLDLDDELGFVILHRCGESFYFLIVCTWRNENELWSTVFAKDGEDEHAFPAVAGRGAAPADVLRLGARRRLARAAGVEPLPAQRARSRRAAGVPARHLPRRGVSRARGSEANRLQGSSRGCPGLARYPPTSQPGARRS